MDTILRAIIGYIFMVLIVRVLARRAGGQMAMFEFVIIFLIGGIAIAATLDGDRSLTNCTCGVITIGMMHTLVSWLKSRSPRFGAIVDGVPLVLYKTGGWQREILDQAKIDPTEILAEVRANGLESLDQVAYVVLERNGAVSVIPKQS